MDTAKIDKQRAAEEQREAAEKQREADREACIENMKEIEDAYRLAMEEGKKVKSLSDLNEWYREKLKELGDDLDHEDLPAKCPSGGKYKLDQRGRVTCPRSEDGHNYIRHFTEKGKTNSKVRRNCLAQNRKKSCGHALPFKSYRRRNQ